MLRDTLTSVSNFDTWPCDEINYIWRHGNRDFPTDEIPAELAEPTAKRFVNNSFDKMAKKNSCQFLVEKTCANSLRVPFVNAVVPDAIYINIVREGRDVVSSALKRWGADLDVKYIARKAKYVPLADIPYYGFRYASHRFSKLTSSESTLPAWGPKYDGMQQDLKKYGLEEVCALQWVNCVEKSRAAFANISAERVINITYEGFVKNPVDSLSDILGHLGIEPSQSQIREAVKGVRGNSVGAGNRKLEHEKEVQVIVGPTNKKLGYN